MNEPGAGRFARLLSLGRPSPRAQRRRRRPSMVVGVDVSPTPAPRGPSRDEPDAIACNAVALPNVMGARTWTSSGSREDGRVARRARRGTATPDDVRESLRDWDHTLADAMNIASTDTSIIAWATPKACSWKAGGVGVSPTPPDEASDAHQPRRGFRGIAPTPSHATSSRRQASWTFPRGLLRGLARGRVVRGLRRSAATPGYVRESLRDRGAFI